MGLEEHRFVGVDGDTMHHMELNRVHDINITLTSDVAVFSPTNIMFE